MQSIYYSSTVGTLARYPLLIVPPTTFGSYSSRLILLLHPCQIPEINHNSSLLYFLRDFPKMSLVLERSEGGGIIYDDSDADTSARRRIRDFSTQNMDAGLPRTDHIEVLGGGKF